MANVNWPVSCTRTRTPDTTHTKVTKPQVFRTGKTTVVDPKCHIGEGEITDLFSLKIDSLS